MQKNQAYLANRDRDSAHHCGCGGRAAVGSGSGRPHGPSGHETAGRPKEKPQRMASRRGRCGRRLQPVRLGRLATAPLLAVFSHRTARQLEFHQVLL